MSLALYPSRVRSNDLLGRSGPEDELITFHVDFAARKWRIRKHPWLNEDTHRWPLKL
jgi:hypothetical protein